MKANNTKLRRLLAIGLPAGLLLFSCSELLHTQISPPKLIVERTEMLANGSDQTLLTAEVNNQLSTRQRLRFSTTNGKLIVIPQSSASVGNDSSILVNPGITQISAVLRTSLTPDDNVYLSATVGSFTTTNTISFKRSCPDEIIVEPNQDSYIVNESIPLELVFLRDDSKKVSVGTRIDCSIDSPDSVEFNAILYSDELGKAKLSVKSFKTGTLKLKFVDRSGCNTAIKEKTLRIK
ncbi:MAG: hypothetical protein C0490_00320 [Marivirga sp.]|nr:hypothetical protein [Marivirga sp.]